MVYFVGYDNDFNNALAFGQVFGSRGDAVSYRLDHPDCDLMSVYEAKVAVSNIRRVVN